MSIKQQILADKNQVVIAIDNNFDFSLHQLFRESYTNCDTPKTNFILDLSRTQYMDSSALGMILLLKDHAEQLGGSVTVSKPSDTVYKILEIAQFHRLVTIEK